jgi:hypothetical protein
MTTASSPDHYIDTREPLVPRAQIESWIRLALVMVVPVLLLLVGISLTR